VREADQDALIIADGFSCREQIAQTTDRRALHLAEVIQLALHQDGQDSPASSDLQHAGRVSQVPSHTVLALVGGIGLAGLCALLWIRGKKKNRR
jgi:hypothetical protein